MYYVARKIDNFCCSGKIRVQNGSSSRLLAFRRDNGLQKAFRLFSDLQATRRESWR